MAITLTKVAGPIPIGDRWQSVYKVALDTSYPTGGYSLKPSDIGLATAANQDAELHAEFQNTNGYGTSYDYVNNKVILYASAGVQVANLADVSAANNVRVRMTSKYRG